MAARLHSWWYDIKNSLWFVPALLTLAAIVLALLTVWIDQTLLLEQRAQVGWLFGGGSEGARGVLEAIASTMVTVTALVFSITVVALQLASSQLSPRVLRAFMADRGNQTVLGFFIGTFTYALLVLRAVRSPLEDTGGFVPSLSVTVAIILALLSVALLIFFVHHAANAMRASVVIDRAASATRDLINHLFPEELGEGARSSPPAWLETRPAAQVRSEASGYLQVINADSLFDLAERHALIIRIEPCVGDFILPGESVAAIWPRNVRDDNVTAAIRAALVLGPERTSQADVAFGFQQLSDIAIKALSPGINDPTTAEICIDRLGELFVHLANRGKPDEVRSSEDGSVRVVLQGPPFADLVGQALDPIRHYGAGDPHVAVHMLGVLGRVAALVPAEHCATITMQASRIKATALGRLTLPEDRARVARAAAWAAKTCTEQARENSGVRQRRHQH
ncbi:MAG: DUF2254 domain-containing protein [Chloroflexota bacterium]|nr:DUF2254 domain-containing protein [Chloroflexota bacterium]